MQAARAGISAGCSLLGRGLRLPPRPALPCRRSRHIVRASAQDENGDLSRRSMLAAAAAIVLSMNAEEAVAVTAAPKAPDPYEVCTYAKAELMNGAFETDCADQHVI